MPRPRLRTVLIGMNLLILALPLAGIQVLRLYESALVRQTESELIAQSAFIAAAYRNAFDRVLAYEQPEAGRSELERHSQLPSAVPETGTGPGVADNWQYRPPILDLVDSNILPPQPEPQPLPHELRPDSLAYIIGQDLESILKDAQRMTLAAIRIVDYQGIVVATTGEDRYLQVTNTEEVALALTGQHVSRLRRKEDVADQTPLQSVSRTSRIRAFVATPILFEDRVVGAVLLSRTPANIVQALYAKRHLLGYAVALLLGVVVLIAFIASRTIVRPLEAIQELARRVSQGDEEAIRNLQDDTTGSIKPGGTAEIVALGEQIAEMGRSLEDRRQYMQEFARHVSHEFKTPLSALRGAIEMFEDHPDMPNAQRSTFLHNMSGDVDHLHRLTNSLLTLARADMREVSQGASTDLHALLRDLVDNHSGNCEIRLELPEQATQVAASSEALAASLTQLLDNAIVHGKTTSLILLQLNHRPANKRAGRPAMARLDISDDGQGISSGNRSKVLQPFFTTAKERGGTGLGLAIAARLLASQGGSLNLLEGPALSGAGFRVELPLAP